MQSAISDKVRECLPTRYGEASLSSSRGWCGGTSRIWECDFLYKVLYKLTFLRKFYFVDFADYPLMC